MRAFDKMSSENQSYLAFNGTHETRGGGHDVDIAIISGSTDNLMHLAPLSEFSGKPLLSYTADGDILSDKVTPESGNNLEISTLTCNFAGKLSQRKSSSST